MSSVEQCKNIEEDDWNMVRAAVAEAFTPKECDNRLKDIKELKRLRAMHQSVVNVAELGKSRLLMCLSLLSNVGVLSNAERMNEFVLDYTVNVIHMNTIAIAEALLRTKVLLNDFDSTYFGSYMDERHYIHERTDLGILDKAEELKLACIILCTKLLIDAIQREAEYMDARSECFHDFNVAKAGNKIMELNLKRHHKKLNEVRTPAAFNWLVNLCLQAFEGILLNAESLARHARR